MHATRTCSIDGCDRWHDSHGFCHVHVYRWRKYGDPLAPGVHLPREGRFCSITDCGRQVYCRGWCSLHYSRWQRSGADPTHPRRPGSKGGPTHPRWRGDDIDYLHFHQRLNYARGNPGDHACVACGGPSQEWAYDHADPNEKVELRGKFLTAFSTDFDHYKPMCISCHRTMDKAFARTRSALA